MYAHFYVRKGRSAVTCILKYNGRTVNYATGIKGNPENFSPETYFSRKENGCAAKNQRLTEYMASVNQVILYYRLETTGKDEVLEAKIRDVFQATRKKSHLFLDVLDEFIKDKSTGTRKVYTDTRNKVMAYDPKCSLESIDVKWLKNFEAHCAKTMSINGYSIHLRNIRAVFNYAIDEDMTELYPFRKFKIKKEETRKRYLTKEQVQTLINYKARIPETQKYVDIFVLMIYLIGINSVDLVNLQEITPDGRIEYRRAKTHRLYSIKLEPEAMDIINKYRGEKHLLDIIEKHASFVNFFHRMAIDLSQILGFRVSGYWSRHTWATTCALLDIPKETIAAGLGHAQSSVTDIYIAFDPRKVDQANRKVIDYFTS